MKPDFLYFSSLLGVFLVVLVFCTPALSLSNSLNRLSKKFPTPSTNVGQHLIIQETRPEELAGVEKNHLLPSSSSLGAASIVHNSTPVLDTTEINETKSDEFLGYVASILPNHSDEAKLSTKELESLPSFLSASVTAAQYDQYIVQQEHTEENEQEHVKIDNKINFPPLLPFESPAIISSDMQNLQIDTIRDGSIVINEGSIVGTFEPHSQ